MSEKEKNEVRYKDVRYLSGGTRLIGQEFNTFYVGWVGMERKYRGCECQIACGNIELNIQVRRM